MGRAFLRQETKSRKREKVVRSDCVNAHHFYKQSQETGCRLGTHVWWDRQDVPVGKGWPGSQLQAQRSLSTARGGSGEGQCPAGLGV